MRQLQQPLRALLLATLLVGCGAAGDRRTSQAGGTLVIATPADADNLLPPLITTTQGKQVADLVFDHLAEIGDSLNTFGDGGFRPALARKWTWAPDSLSIAFELDPRARWHDGKPVTARDVRFTLDLMRDSTVGSPQADQLAELDSVSVRDSATAVLWWHARSPEQFFRAVYNMAILPEHALSGVKRGELAASAFASQPIGSGRFRLRTWTRGQRIELVADSANYRGRPTLDRVVWTVTPDAAGAALKVLAGEADFLEALRGDAVAKAAQSPRVRAVPYGSLDYGYLLFNFRDPAHAARPHPVLADRAVREAVAHALDRAALVKNVLDTLGYVAMGPVTRAQATADASLRHAEHDTAATARLLDAAGWRRPSPGATRARAGQPLKLALLVPASSSTRMQLAVLVQAQLAAQGIEVSVEKRDPTTFAQELGQGHFDMALNVWRTDPSPATVRQTWGTPHGDDPQGNFGRFSSRAFDAQVDSAAAEFDPARGRALYRRAYQTLLDEVPAVFLYEPRNLAAASRGLTLTGVRADAWWAGLADWRRGTASTTVASAAH